MFKAILGLAYGTIYVSWVVISHVNNILQYLYLYFYTYTYTSMMWRAQCWENWFKEKGAYVRNLVVIPLEKHMICSELVSQ